MKKKVPFDLEYLQKFYRHSVLWLVREFEGGEPRLPDKPMVSSEIGAFWPIFADKGLAFDFIRKHGLEGYKPFDLYTIWDFYNFVNKISTSEVTNVGIYTEKDKPQIYQAKDLLEKIEKHLD